MDEEKFQKMVERQYEIMKGERMRQMDEPNVTKPPQRSEEHDIPAAPQPSSTTTASAESNEQEV